MNSLTSEQASRVFAMYLHAPVQYNRHHEDSEEPRNVQRRLNLTCLLTLFEMSDMVGIEGHITDVRLLLRPLSAISDEDAIEVASICGQPFLKTVPNTVGCRFQITTASTVESGRTDRAIWMRDNGVVELFSNNGDWGGCKTVAVDSFSIIQYLIQQGYAVPLFIAPGHPDNGKDAIQLGLALDSTLLLDLKGEEG